MRTRRLNQLKRKYRKENIEKLKIDEKILVYALHLRQYHKKFILIKNYYGPDIYKNLSLILSLDEVYLYFKHLQSYPEELEEIPDCYPFFRRTYYKNFINSILIQIELFLHKKTHLKSPEIIQALIGSDKVLPPFDAKAELELAISILNKFGLKSLDDYRIYHNELKIEKQSDHLFKHILSKLYENIVDRLIQETSEYDFPFFSLFEKSSLKFKLDEYVKNNFYNYTSSGCGTVEFNIKDNISFLYIKTFILQETVPGKHLYSLMRQYFCDNPSSSIPQDALRFIEPELSPEKIFSDSLSICSKLLFPKLVDPDCFLAFEIEKLYCKLLYNGWYYRFIDRSISVSKYFEFISKLINVEEKHLKFKARRLFEDSKYTMVFIPYGISLIESSIRRCTPNSVLWFYTQQSQQTLEKCLEWEEGQESKFYIN